MVSTMFSTSQVERQRSFIRVAQHVHRGQKRRDGRAYMTHPIAVAEIVEQQFTELSLEDLHLAVCVAVMHDTIEDGALSRSDLFVLVQSDYELDGNNEFLDEIGIVLDAVEIVSNTSHKPYSEFVKDIVDSGNRLAIIVKYCDMIHNMSCCIKELSIFQTASEKTAKQLTKYSSNIDTVISALKKVV